MKKFIDIGVVVRDISYGMTGIVLEKNVSISHSFDDAGMDSMWDWSILYEDGRVGYADNIELEIVDL